MNMRAEYLDEHYSNNRYYDHVFGNEAVKVLPGEYCISDDDTVLVTVLGSCVTACIRDAEAGVGGMNHFMLADGSDDPLGASARYGAYAMEILINHLLKCGARRERLEAKLFGGGRVLDGLSGTGIGRRNAEFAVKYLQAEQIPVIAHDLLDVHPRKVYFFTQTGRVLVRRLARLHNDTLMRREREYAALLKDGGVSGAVEMFQG